MRLIDADKLRNKFQAILDRGDMFCEYDIIGMLDNSPTVEYPEAITIKCDTEEDKQKLLSALRNASARLEVRVEEDRPTGEWIEHDDERWGSVWYTCSNCHRDAPYEQAAYNIWRQKLSDFCPNCGARMEVENDQL